jgi:hypothetical protein
MEAGWQLLTLEVIDYMVQAVLFMLGFIHPWIVPRGHGARVFGYPLLVAFFWCFWRMLLFDPAIKNDVPGIGYLFVGFMLGTIGLALYGLRCLFTRSTPAPNNANQA